MDEFELIRRFFHRPVRDDSVTTGVGDDGAVLVVDPDRELVTVVDTLVESVHFPSAIAAYDLGYRAVAVNLSDIAAMGASPRWMTLALTLTHSDNVWLEKFSDGLYAAASENSVTLIGGDMTRGDAIVVTIQIIGDVSAGDALTRAGARIGDRIFVSGTIGDASAGLHLIKRGSTLNAEQQFLADRFLRPSARVSLGQSLLGIASAAIDVSDGLCADVSHILEQSDVAGCLAIEQLPMSDALMSAYDAERAEAFQLAGGDDYELCFTASLEQESAIMRIADDVGVAVTTIGDIEAGSGLVLKRDGQAVELEAAGYLHFGREA